MRAVFHIVVERKEWIEVALEADSVEDATQRWSEGEEIFSSSEVTAIRVTTIDRLPISDGKDD